MLCEEDIVKKILVITLIAIISIILLCFMYSKVHKHIISKAKNTSMIPEVTIQTVKNESVVRSFVASGRVVSKYQVSIIARVAGYLQKSYFHEGSYVKAGDTLFLIQPEEYKNSVDVKNIKAQLEYANKQLERAKELVKNGFIAKTKYDELLANRDNLQAKLKASDTFQEDNKKHNSGYTHVKAPVDGRIGTVDVTVGNYVTPSSGSLTTINSTNPIYVTFPLSVDNYQKLTACDKDVNVKRKVELFFNNGEKYKYNGIQDFSDNNVDMTAGTMTLRATFQNPENRLLHGQLVRVKIFSSSPISAPVVPITAVQENSEGKYVYILDKDNIPHIRHIETDSQAGYNWIVKNGLKVGDVIIKEGAQKVLPNMPVNVVK